VEHVNRPAASENTDAGVDEILAEVQADDYYAIVPEWVLFHPELSHGAVRLYGVLRRFADQRGIAFPGLSAIGEKYGVVPRSVTRHMDELTAVGAVTKKRRIRDGKVTSNLYRVHSRATFITVQHDYTPDNTAAVDARRTEMSDGPTDKNVRRSTDKNVRLTTATTNHNQDDPQSSGALRAPTAETVETSRSSVTSRNANAGAAAADEPEGDHGDAPRAVGSPSSILDTMMLNPDEQTRFRTWLIEAAGATNPEGLVVSLHGAGRLSERIMQWRGSEAAPTPQMPAQARPGHLAWCGRCDHTTRMAVAHDDAGREYVRRCPDCNINAGQPVPGSGAAQAIALEAAMAAASGRGRAAFEEARAALPQGVGRRTTTFGDVIDPTAALHRAESEQSA
jgi:DNA-binding transcriptional ArsR family regulator